MADVTSAGAATMRNHPTSISLGLLALAVTACVHLPGAGSPLARLEPGQRIRVKVEAAQPPRQTGTLVALTADSLVLKKEGTAPTATDAARVAFPVAAVTQVEKSTGVHRQTLQGAIYGGQVGLIAVLVGFLAGEWVAGDTESLGVFAGCVVVGGTIGTIVRKEDWRPLPLSSVRISVAPFPAGGLGLGATFAFPR